MEIRIRRKIQFISLLTAACLIGDSMLYIVLPIYWESVGLTAFWQVGVVLSLNRFIRFITNPIAGWFYQRYQLKNGFVLSILITTIVTIGYASFKGFMLWCILRILWGSSWSLLRIGGLSIVTQIDSNRRGHLMGMYNGLYRIGSLIGTLFGGMVAPMIGLRGIALAISPFPLMFIPGLRILGNDSNILSQLLQTKINRKEIPNRLYVLYLTLASGFLIAMVFQGIFTSTLSIVINNNYHQITWFGLTLSTVLVSGSLQSLRWAWEPFLAAKFGKWTDRSKERISFYVILLLVSGFGFFILVHRIHFLYFILFSLWVLVTATGLSTTTDSLASDISRQNLNLNILSLYSVMQDMGAAFGPLLGYFLISIGGFGLTYSLIGGVLVSLAVIWIIIMFKDNRMVTLEQ